MVQRSQPFNITGDLYRSGEDAVLPYTAAEPLAVMAIDPGETTGYAIVSLDFPEVFLKLGTTPTWQGIDRLIDLYRPRYVVIEKFILYPKMARVQSWSSFIPVRVIGAVCYMCELRGISVVEQVAASIARVPLPDKFPERSEHIKDAYKHAYLFAKSRYGK